MRALLVQHSWKNQSWHTYWKAFFSFSINPANLLPLPFLITCLPLQCSKNPESVSLKGTEHGRKQNMAGNRIVLLCFGDPFQLDKVSSPALTKKKKKKKEKILLENSFLLPSKNLSYFFFVKCIRQRYWWQFCFSQEWRCERILCPENKFSVKSVHYTWLLEYS